MTNFFQRIASELDDIEKELDVDQYLYQQVHLWPIFRLAYYIIEKKKRNGHTRAHWLKSCFLRVSHLAIRLFTVRKFIDESVKYLFIGANSHRINRNGKMENRFFSHMQGPDSLILEYDNSLLNLGDNTVSFEEIFGRIDGVKIDESPVNNFIKDLSKMDLINFDTLFRIEAFIFNVLKYYTRISQVLSSTNIQTVYTLCYYSQPALGLVTACNALGLRTIEVQHGPIGDNHLAYSGWSERSNAEAYLCLPQALHIWHDKFRPYISDVFKEVEVTGNYSFDTTISRTKKDGMKPTVLITLQPAESKLNPRYKAIIKYFAKDVYFVVRQHPRQNINTAFVLMRIYFKYRYKVRFHRAKDKSIQEILSVTSCHLTGFSGSFYEAFSTGVPTIFISDKAHQFFSEFENDKSGCANFCSEYSDKQLIQIVNEIIK